MGLGEIKLCNLIREGKRQRNTADRDRDLMVPAAMKTKLDMGLETGAELF